MPAHVVFKGQGSRFQGNHRRSQVYRTSHVRGGSADAVPRCQTATAPYCSLPQVREGGSDAFWRLYGISITTMDLVPFRTASVAAARSAL